MTKGDYITLSAGTTIWVQWVSDHFAECTLEEPVKGKIIRDYFEPKLEREVFKIKSADMPSVKSKKSGDLAVIPGMYPFYASKDVKEEIKEKLELIGEVLTKVHFRTDWKEEYTESDWYFFVYRFNLAGRKELYSFIQRFIRKPDGTAYETKDLRKLGDSRLKAMFRKYKPIEFGRHPKDL